MYKIVAIILILINTKCCCQPNFNTIRKQQHVVYIKKKTIPVESSEKISLETNYTRNKQFYLPLDTIIVTSNYGIRKDPFTGKYAFHRGIDLRANKDTVYNIMHGVVEKIGNNKKMGIYAVVYHGMYATTFAHLDKIYVDKKQILKAGQMIGVSGNTGKSTAPHLHFSIKKRGRHIDPLPYINMIEAFEISQ